MEDKLTQKQETFALNLFNGMYQRDAYIAVYHPTYALPTIDANASRLASNEKVLARIAELREEAKDATIADYQERQRILSEIARGRVTDYQSSDGIYIDSNSPNTGAIEGLEIRSSTSRDSQAGNITIKRPVVPEAMRNKIFSRDGNKCVLCASTDNLQLDHIVSLSKGGHTEESNLQTLCEECNKTKGAGKKSQAYITTKLKLHNPMQAIDVLNKMDKVYDDRIPVGNTVVNSFTFILPDGTRASPRQLISIEEGKSATKQIQDEGAQAADTCQT